MGSYLNPGSMLFRGSLRSKIYVDKSGLIEKINELVCTEQKYVCVSRPRRFGKSMAANMLAAYYKKDEDTRPLFDKLLISQSESYEEHLNQYDVIRINMQQFLSETHNMEEMLSTRRAHEDLTTEVGKYLNKEGYETYILSTESCDICEKCAYKEGKPCRYPDRMHPCLESHGVVVNEIVERESMEYNLGGNTILWFSMVLFR